MASTTTIEIKSQFNRARQEVDQDIQEALIVGGHLALQGVIERTPVWTGSYLLSHRVGINAKSTEPPTYINQHPEFNGLTPGEEEAYRQKAMMQANKIQTAQNINSVWVSNGIGHAPDVEYIGWPSGKPPYHTYGLTYTWLKASMPSTLAGTIKITMSKLVSAIKKRASAIDTRAYPKYEGQKVTGADVSYIEFGNYDLGL